jgi:hypothetical protein
MQNSRRRSKPSRIVHPARLSRRRRRHPGRRLSAGVALAANVAGDIMTFAYFHPRNDIMFVNPMNADAAAQAWRGFRVPSLVENAVFSR